VVGRRLGRAFFRQGTVAVAQALLGKLLVHDGTAGRTVGRIVETEAYLSDRDPGSHAFRGETVRNASMFGPPGHAYVYFVYGMHHCFNVVTGPAGVGEAVLVRALEPLEGVALMRARRGAHADRDLCNGPAKLVQAMGLEREHDGADLLAGNVGLFHAGPGAARFAELEIVRTIRVGLTRGSELELRFYVRGEPCVSRA
jgi:DNA-3-methyladenine glycosylase